MTTVVNRKVTTAYDVYIGRPSKWGNPYSVGQIHPLTGTPMTRADVIEAYERYLQRMPSLLADLHELKDKRLGCWCAPQPCHGDVLARLADALP